MDLTSIVAIFGLIYSALNIIKSFHDSGEDKKSQEVERRKKLVEMQQMSIENTEIEVNMSKGIAQTAIELLGEYRVVHEQNRKLIESCQRYRIGYEILRRQIVGIGQTPEYNIEASDDVM